jgi:uncharacterized protein (TIGR03435 family)
MRSVLAAAMLVAGSIAALAQSRAPAVSLEAASIKPAPPGSVGIVAGNWAPPTNTSARLRPMTLRTLVMYAFDLQPRRHDPEPVGGQAWMDKDLYELTLKFTALPTIPQAQALIKALLEDRFKLKWHDEKRELPLYELVVVRPDGRLGPGLKPSRLDCRAYSETLTRTGRGAVAKELAPDCGLSSGGAPAVAATLNLPPGSSTYPRGAQLIRGTATMAEIVTALGRDRENDRPIVDRTGLTGTFDIDFWWVPAQSGAIVAEPTEVMPLSVALPQQLGVKLDSRREPRDVVVIDSASRPMPD